MTRIGTLSSRVAAPSLAVALVVLLAGCKVFETNAPPPEFSVPEAFDEAPKSAVLRLHKTLRIGGRSGVIRRWIA